MGKAFSDIFKDLGVGQAWEAVTGQDAARKSAEQAGREAQRIQLETAAAAREAATTQRNMQANFATDLSNQSKATVVAGGTADDIASTTDIAKKRRLGTNFASSLGINA